MIVREPVVNGLFYSNDPQKLKEEITYLLPQGIERKNRLSAYGAIVPHGKFSVSGEIQANLYSEIEFTENFIIIGPFHKTTSSTISLFNRGFWQTPLGMIEVNDRLANEIKLNAKDIVCDPEAHSEEYSIEVQLPFLQYFFDFPHKPKIIPILLSPNLERKLSIDLGYAIVRAIYNFDKPVTIIATAEFLEKKGAYLTAERTNTKERNIVEALLNLEHQRLLELSEESEVYFCGYLCCLALLVAVKELGASKTKLVKYRSPFLGIIIY